MAGSGHYAAQHVDDLCVAQRALGKMDYSLVYDADPYLAVDSARNKISRNRASLIMQMLPYLFSHTIKSNVRTSTVGLVVVLAVHLLIILFALWTPSKLPVPDAQAIAPKILEVSLLTAAPPQPITELAPGPQQVEAAAAQKPIKNTEKKQELITHKDAHTTISETVKTPEPIAEEIPEEVEEEVLTEQKVPAQPAPATTAPTTLPAPPAETATATNMGANQQQMLDIKLNWQHQLQMHLERWKRYPRRAQMRNQEGMPWIKFSMDRSGKVLSVSLVQSSGVDSLDKEALALVKRAAPLPIPPPDIIEGDEITLTVPIEFFINQ